MSFLKLVLFLTAINIPTTVQAGWGNSNNARDAAWNSKSDTTSTGYKTFQELQSKLAPETGDILDNLAEYDKFWVEVKHPHGASGSCVWSECKTGYTNSNDDQYGDGRDGDEQWYQYRTQSFCANAAYSLYGRKKSDWNPMGFIGCSRRHYINSFFTYGGADNLLKSLEKVPKLYYDSDYYYENQASQVNGGNQDNNNQDDGQNYYTEPSNADCLAYYDYAPPDMDDDYAQWQNGGNNNNNQNRELSSGSEDYSQQGYSSTLGCSGDGKYVMSIFQGNSCDGNNFIQDINKFRAYNRQHNHVGCHSLWHSGSSETTYENMRELLSNSWSCDTKVYPHQCPDPYGEKARYEYALRTAAHGGNPMAAYRNSLMRRPIRILSWIMLLITICVLLVTYNVKNHKRIMDRGGGWKVSLQCLREDGKVRWASATAAAQIYWESARKAAAERRAQRSVEAEARQRRREERKSRSRSGGGGKDGERRRRRKSKKSKSKRRSKSRGDEFYDGEDGAEGGNGVEMGRISSSSRRSRSERGSYSYDEEGGGDGAERRSRRKSKSKKSSSRSRSRRGESGELDSTLDDEGTGGVMA